MTKQLSPPTLEYGEWTGELGPIIKEGKRLIIEAQWSPVRDEHGELTPVLTINTAFTKRKRMEKQFPRAQRTESIGTLAGGSVHGIDNVLAPILMSIELPMHDESRTKLLQMLEDEDSLRQALKKFSCRVLPAADSAGAMKGGTERTCVRHFIPKTDTSDTL